MPDAAIAACPIIRLGGQTELAAFFARANRVSQEIAARKKCQFSLSPGDLQQVEGDEHVGQYVYGVTVFHAWFEFPLLDGFNGFFVETEAEALDDMGVADPAVGVDNDGYCYRAAHFGFAAFFGEFGIHFVDGDRV